MTITIITVYVSNAKSSTEHDWNIFNWRRNGKSIKEGNGLTMGMISTIEIW